ncbi:putative inactive purple acid phosphatase 24 [Morella rubra]|uniref:Putative inactive purple acid phosphatase 24 n=1 Tax=Morella rubra TaxID=262757 RepID=A0A6A1VWT0_9ROSI|nr:putative inactive purple acid phosphatase 24 [Morella rubra]
MAESFRGLKMFTAVVLLFLVFAHASGLDEEHPLSKIAIHMATRKLSESVTIKAAPQILGLQGEDTQWVTVGIKNPNPSAADWVAVFSPANFK